MLWSDKKRQDIDEVAKDDRKIFLVSQCSIYYVAVKTNRTSSTGTQHNFSTVLAVIHRARSICGMIDLDVQEECEPKLLSNIGKL